MLDAGKIASLTSLSGAAWTAVLVGTVWIIRTWPVWKQRLNEARKIELDADEGLRASLIDRIHQLEEIQSRDRAEFFRAMAEERKRCAAEIEEIRAMLRRTEEDNRGLMAMIRQNSASTAMVVTNPDGTALTTAARRARGEGEKK